MPTEEAGRLYRLMTWLSPSYPVGSFSYSHGIEWVVEQGSVRDAPTLRGWVEDVLAHGSGRNDAVLFAHAWRAARDGDDDALRAVAELAAAWTSSRERLLETGSQGDAFVKTSRATWPCTALDRLAAVWQGVVAYPVAVAVTAAGHGIPVRPALAATLHAFAANLVSAGGRLVPLGQTDTQTVIAQLMPSIEGLTDEALSTPLEDLGGCAVLSDIASMRHETQYTRLFRT